MVPFVIQTLRYSSITLTCSLVGAVAALACLYSADYIGAHVFHQEVALFIQRYLDQLPGPKFDPLAHTLATYLLFIFIGLVLGFVWGHVLFIRANKRHHEAETSRKSS